MFIKNFKPRFNDTDALGHINNASIVTWFEHARRPIFEIFNPELSISKWNLILARIEVDYLGQVSFSDEVEIKTYFEKVGKSSMTIVQDAYQGSKHVAKGKTIMVHYNYKEDKSEAIPENIKTILLTHQK